MSRSEKFLWRTAGVRHRNVIFCVTPIHMRHRIDFLSGAPIHMRHRIPFFSGAPVTMHHKKGCSDSQGNDWGGPHQDFVAHPISVRHRNCCFCGAFLSVRHKISFLWRMLFWCATEGHAVERQFSTSACRAGFLATRSEERRVGKEC